MEVEIRRNPGPVTIWLELIAHYTHIVKANQILIVKKDVDKNPPLGVLFSTAIYAIQPNYSSFQTELRNSLSQSRDRRADLSIYISDFMPYIKEFKQWYADHENDIAIFGENSPYQHLYHAVIDTERELLRQEEAIKGGKKKVPLFRDTLEKACLGPDHYNELRTWFIDTGLCNPDTFIWEDTKKSGKAILINYLNDAHVKGYIHKLKQNEVKAIALNDFRIDISIDTVKRPGPTTGIKEMPAYKG